MPVLWIDCSDCGGQTDVWIERGAARVCLGCNERRLARALLADELATGRAAVRALYEYWACDHWRNCHVDCDGTKRWCKDRPPAVLATDTAKRWLREEQDGEGPLSRHPSSVAGVLRRTSEQTPLSG